MPSPRHPGEASTVVGVFIISAAILALEVLHLRILSVMMWYHHAYLIVTMAMLGFAISGTLTTVVPWFARGDVQQKLAWFANLFGVGIIAAQFLLAKVTGDRHMLSDSSNWSTLALACIILLIPYICGGMVLTIALTSAPRIHHRYSANLIGSALGAWVFIASITSLGGERLLVVCSTLAPVAALCFLGSKGGFSKIATFPSGGLPLSGAAV